MGKSKKTKNQESEKTIKESLWVKAFSRDVDWSKEELLDVVHWVRQFVSIMIGIIWGFSQLKGIAAMASYFVANIGIIFIYYSRFLGVDDDLIVGRWPLIQEGLASGFASFMITWITTFNLNWF
eukprot:TRINITY_DN1560_c1_g1_i1.p1 TRINITY_DN1560_c1_g1~~TRINITY_DN1560_c1_g1_i1.p1  ORF type:complete len:124 (-),score=47.24 TRINITY_DN1560_c1_g1_i1:103-474(-)